MTVTREDVKSLLRQIKLSFHRFNLPLDSIELDQLADIWLRGLSVASSYEVLTEAFNEWLYTESNTPSLADIRKRVLEVEGVNKAKSKSSTMVELKQYAAEDKLIVAYTEHEGGWAATMLKKSECLKWHGKYYHRIEFLQNVLSPAVVNGNFQEFVEKHTKSNTFSELIEKFKDPEILEQYNAMLRMLAKNAFEVAHSHGLQFVEAEEGQS